MSERVWSCAMLERSVVVCYDRESVVVCYVREECGRVLC